MMTELQYQLAWARTYLKNYGVINKIAQYGIGVREVVTYEIDEEFFQKI
jgi:hypothetical protein